MPDEAEAFDTPILIGARNPFVYAEHKLNKKIHWDDIGEREKKDTLEQVFKKPYAEIFDITESMVESPHSLFVQTDVETGDLRPCTTVSNPIWAPNPEGNNYTVTSRAYNDPIQGDLPDCYLIAALSSLAFLSLIPSKQPPYTYTFFNLPVVVGGTPSPDAPVTVTNLLPLDANNKYHYSKSCTAGEIWIAIYEKAFARWVNRRVGTDSDTPDYSKICQGDPIAALMNITGWKGSRFFTTSYANGTLIYDKIKTACKSPGYVIAAKPMVAYTYDPRIERPPSGATYTDATIVGNHSYSVLGVHTSGTEKYIVMRNPWGQMDPNPSNLPPGALAAGSWNNITLNSSDAIFALKADVFRDYFKGFGWVSL
jgi:hypothetical protein